MPILLSWEIAEKDQWKISEVILEEICGETPGEFFTEKQMNENAFKLEESSDEVLLKSI